MTRWLVPEELGHYEPISRSLRIEGYSTSVRLERVFWDVLDQMAAARRVSTCHLLSAIYREVHANGDSRTNFSSVLRVICLRHRECGAPTLSLFHGSVPAARGENGAHVLPPGAQHPEGDRAFAPGVPSPIYPPPRPDSAR